MRRRALLLGGCGALAGCGFHPTYAPTGPGGAASSAAAQQLAAIDVPVIPERAGMLMRQSLQERLQRFGIDAPKRYRLDVQFSINVEQVAIIQNSLPTYQRMIGEARYTLVALPPASGTVTSGSTRVVDGLNLFDNQPFAADLESSAVTRRLADSLADQIVLRIAGYFSRQARGHA